VGSGTLDEIAALIGRPGALALASSCGGKRVYFSSPPLKAIELLGEIVIARLANEYRGEPVDIPLPPLPEVRRAEARRLRAQRLSIPEIADQLGISRQRARVLVLSLAADDNEA
jgi:Homeodomain-like domain-containing protein